MQNLIIYGDLANRRVTDETGAPLTLPPFVQGDFVSFALRLTDPDETSSATTGQMRIAISRRTVTKYRLAIGTRRQGTMKAAIAEALERDPELTDAELAAMLSESTRTPVSPMSVARNRIKLGIRHRRPNRRHRN